MYQRPRWPKWLGRIRETGVARSLDEWEKVSLCHSAVDDEFLGRLCAHDELIWLDLSFTQITDDGVAKLRPLKSYNVEANLKKDRAGSISRSAQETQCQKLVTFRKLQTLMP